MYLAKNSKNTHNLKNFIQFLVVTLGLISGNFKILVFDPNLSFLRRNHKNANGSEFPEFYEFTHYMIFAIFLKMAIPIIAIFVENFKNHI